MWRKLSATSSDRLRWSFPRAESFQSHVVTDQHIRALADAGICSDVRPKELSRNLWGYLNVCLVGAEKVVFDNIDPRNEFVA